MPASAWDLLVRADPRLAASLKPLEREILGLMTPAQAESFAQGAAASSIRLANGESLEQFLQQKGVPQFELSWFSVDGGGAAMSGGDFNLAGIAGQADGGTLTGGAFRLTGGFFAAIPPPVTPLCTGDNLIFCNGFESGNLQGWDQVFSGI